MPDHIEVSVIIPSYNCAGYLGEALRSVFEQSYRFIEVIVVDDGSTDSSPKLLADILPSAPIPMRVFHQANAGVAAARNSAIEKACGEFIVPLDGDDQLHCDFIAAAMVPARSGFDIVYPDRLEFGGLNRLCLAGEFNLARLQQFNQLSYCALYARSLWHRTGGYATNVSGFDDWDFWISAAKLGARAVRLPGVPFRHRRRADSQIRDIRQRYDMLYAQIILNHPDLYPEMISHAEAVLQGRADFRAQRWLFDQGYGSGR